MWKRKEERLIKPPKEYALETKYRPVLESLIPPDPMNKLKLKRGCPKEEFPSLDKNYTCMARVLDLHMYTRQFNRATESGVIFDDIIRPGLEDPDLSKESPVSVFFKRRVSSEYTGFHPQSQGMHIRLNGCTKSPLMDWRVVQGVHCYCSGSAEIGSMKHLTYQGTRTGPLTVGCLAGDAQSYILFCDFFDRIIGVYQSYKVLGHITQKSDFNYDNLKGGDDFDQEYAVSCEVSASRCIEDFSFPTHCSRGERRHLLTLAKKALDQLSEELPGKLYSMDELSQETEDRGLILDAPPAMLMKTGVARDWPDARALWMSENGSLAVWVNMEDHLKLVSSRSDGNIQEAFASVCINLVKLEAMYSKLRHPFIWKPHLGWVVSSPAEVGTGLKASVTVRLIHLSKHKHLNNILDRLRLRMETDNSPGLYKISNLQTIGLTEVEFTQLVVDGVKLLIRIEKRLEDNIGIDDLVPAQK